MPHSKNLIHRIKEQAAKTGKTGKYILAMTVPLLLQTLNTQEAKAMTRQNAPQTIEIKDIKKTVKTKPDNDPASVKEIELKAEYREPTKDFFIFMTEQLNKNLDNIQQINALRDKLNHNIHSANPIDIDGISVARLRVTSFFAIENDEVILKNASAEINKQPIYDVEATVKNFVYNHEQTILFVTNEKKYDYDIVLRLSGEVVIVQKDKKNKELKLKNDADVVKFDAFLKEIFPPAYITYRDQAWEENQAKEQNAKDPKKK